MKRANPAPRKNAPITTLDSIVQAISSIAEDSNSRDRLRALALLSRLHGSGPPTLPAPMTDEEMVQRLARLMRAAPDHLVRQAYDLHHANPLPPPPAIPDGAPQDNPPDLDSPEVPPAALQPGPVSVKATPGNSPTALTSPTEAEGPAPAPPIKSRHPGFLALLRDSSA